MKRKGLLLLGLLLGLTACGQEPAQGDETALAMAYENRLLMVNDTLYYGTNQTGPMGDSEAVAGEITSETAQGTVPTENGQSNFGCVGNVYTMGEESIMVQIDEEWFVFATEEALPDFVEKESPWSAENPYENRLLRVNDTLYYGTDQTGPMGDSEAVAGEITSETSQGAVPTENGQSNFGCVGNAYTIGEETIMVQIGEEWFVFAKESEQE